MKHGIKTLNGVEFLNLIATRRLGNGKVDEKTKTKMEKEKEEPIRKAAKEMERREQKPHNSTDTGKGVDPSTQLWSAIRATKSEGGLWQ